MEYCKQCGQPLTGTEFFCSKCGHRVRETGIPVPAKNIPLSQNRLLYIVMGVLFGYLGIHNFIAGYTGKGIAQLLISLLSFGLLSIVSYIWAIVEICTVTVNAKGEPLLFNL